MGPVGQPLGTKHAITGLFSTSDIAFLFLYLPLNFFNLLRSRDAVGCGSKLTKKVPSHCAKYL